MQLKIGELSKRTGLTVRTLHHYDAIGLLAPSARSAAGYRLYNRVDIARLHQFQALRKFGLSLADIGAYLARPDLPLAQVVAQQIDQLTRQIEQATALRQRRSARSPACHGTGGAVGAWWCAMRRPARNCLPS